MRAARVLPFLFLAIVTGCSDDGIFGIGSRYDFEGFYSYAGTVDDAAGDAVIGSVTITRQRSGTAEVSIDWTYLDNGEAIIQITTDSPALANIDNDGWIDFSFEGDLFYDDAVVGFTLYHEGRLNGRTLTGYWEFDTGTPTFDSGSFTARR